MQAQLDALSAERDALRHSSAQSAAAHDRHRSTVRQHAP
jgi:hypothetical protein